MPVKPHVIIVGLGLTGLSAACTLSGRGLDILLMDENTRPGGNTRAGRDDSRPARERLKRQGYGWVYELRRQTKCNRGSRLPREGGAATDPAPGDHLRRFSQRKRPGVERDVRGTARFPGHLPPRGHCLGANQAQDRQWIDHPGRP